jgi:hypothetical protein
MVETICFRVVKEPYGWAVRMGDGVMTPFRSRGLAVRHARDFVDALRRRGESAEILIEESWAPARSGGAKRRHRAF